MYNNEATAHGKLNLKSLLICWLIILAGYLMIRIVFLVFGLQLYLTAQGACLRCCRTALGHCICGSVARSKNRGFIYSDSCFLPLPRS